MKKLYPLTISLILLISANSFAQQSIEIPLEEGAWQFAPGILEFIQYKSKPAMKLLESGESAFLKDFVFTTGTIEFDIIPLDPTFSSFYFRWEDESESELIYFRNARAGNPDAVDAIQYAPVIKGVNLWDVLFHYQSNLTFSTDSWNHVKAVISEKQMRVYVNDMDTPVLEVPRLEANVTEGTLGFGGQLAVSNLTVTQGEVEDLPHIAGMDPTFNDPRYLRKWRVSQPVTTEENIDFREEYIPSENAMWEEITAERRGLINLTRKFGIEAGSRRIVWLKTTIHSDVAQEKILRFGFSDEVWMLINELPLYVDKNLYARPLSKSPDGRLSIENSTITVPLQEGENELMVGVTNFFFGWGIVARFDDLTGIHLER